MKRLLIRKNDPLKISTTLEASSESDLKACR